MNEIERNKMEYLIRDMRMASIQLHEAAHDRKNLLAQAKEKNRFEKVAKTVLGTVKK